GLSLSAQIYDAQEGVVIDAFSLSDERASLSGLLSESEIAALGPPNEPETVENFSARIASRILTNPNKTRRPENISQFLDGTAVGRELKFPRSVVSVRDDAFRMLEEQRIAIGTRGTQTLREVPATIRVITDEDIRRHRYQYLEDLLRDQPGFDMIFFQGVYGPIFMQQGIDGPENFRTLVFVDGVPDNNISSGSAYIKHKYRLHNVKRVEILYGPASSLYGANAFSGVINIITKDGSDIQKVIEAGVGSLYYESTFHRPAPNGFLTIGGVAMPGEDAISVIASAHWINSEGPILNQKSNVDPTKSTYYWTDGYSNSRLSDNYMASLKMQYRSVTLGMWQERDYTGQGTFASAAAYLDDGRKTFWNTLTTTYYGKFDQPIGMLQEHLQASYRETSVTDGADVDRSTIGSFNGKVTATRYRRPDSEISLDNPLQIKWSNNSYTTVGAAYVRQQPWTYNTRAVTYDSTAALYLIGMPASPDLDPRNKFYATSKAGYAEHYMRLAGAFGTSVGYRYDHFTIEGKDGPEFCGTDEISLPGGAPNPHFISPEAAQAAGCVLNERRQYYSHRAGDRNYDSSNPRIGLIYSSSSLLTAKLSVGEAFRVPTVRELYSLSSSRISNSKLDPEKIRTAEASVIYYPTETIRTESVIFASYVRDLISLAATDVHTPGKSQSTYLSAFQNAGSAQIYGTQLSAEGDILPWLRALWNYTYQQSWIFDAKDSNLLAHSGAIDESLRPSDTTICRNTLVSTGYSQFNPLCPRAHGRMPRIASHKMTAGVTILLSQHWQIDTRLNYVGSRRTIATDPVTSVPSYVLANISLGTKDFPLKGMDITLKVFNAFNEAILDPGTRDGRGDYFPSVHPQPERYLGWDLTYRL
ncbi:MAG TPA: TonB-dependent receptor, partial [Leptospiraceae bacterium]|nr:TonB-dependent receptor [Leptospiraceae bacterium]